MTKPYIHFTKEEFLQRQKKTRQYLQNLGLDGLLLFKIEDMYWLTGYESDGFCVFGYAPGSDSAAGICRAGCDHARWLGLRTLPACSSSSGTL